MADSGGSDSPAGVDEKSAPSQARRFAAPISAVLMWGFGSLVFLAVAGVLAISLWSAHRNTADLLRDKVELQLDALVERVQTHLDPVSVGNAFLAGLMARGEIDPGDHAQLVDYMTAAMAATPQVRGMGFFDTNLMVTRAVRSSGGVTIQLNDQSGDPAAALMMENARAQPEPYWGELVRSDVVKSTVLNRRAPVWRDGKFLGVLVTAVTVSDLSRYLGRRNKAETEAERFILYGSEYVLAHRAMTKGTYTLSERQPLPSLGQIGDPVLANLWNAATRYTLQLPLGPETSGHGINIEDEPYIVLFREVVGYGAAPLRIGAYFRLDPTTVGKEIRRLVRASLVGFLILLIAVTAALLLGRRMSRPIRNLARAAESVRGLDFSRVPALRRSRLRELDEASVAFNAMVSGLRMFETYVPRTLVRRLLEKDSDAELVSEERIVTVLFTDIRSFTGLAENMSAAETAAFLNQHFSLLASCIEAERGTVDKYIGDSVMAFWGAPATDGSGVERACRAALAIRRIVTQDNEHRTRRGDAPVRVRIGIHTGPAIVGNIGAPGRINYTLVGDTVNIAQRLEELCKEMGGGGTVEILVSGEVAEEMGGGYHLTPQGPRPIRGRSGFLKIYRLE
ncbi:MAG: adenylate/guanylate cyclase domain-containing protein [Alphaproteobacteria bacterium]